MLNLPSNADLRQGISEFLSQSGNWYSVFPCHRSQAELATEWLAITEMFLLTRQQGASDWELVCYPAKEDGRVYIASLDDDRDEVVSWAKLLPLPPNESQVWLDEFSQQKIDESGNVVITKSILELQKMMNERRSLTSGGFQMIAGYDVGRLSARYTIDNRRFEGFLLGMYHQSVDGDPDFRELHLGHTGLTDIAGVTKEYWLRKSP